MVRSGKITKVFVDPDAPDEDWFWEIATFFFTTPIAGSSLHYGTTYQKWGVAFWQGRTVGKTCYINSGRIVHINV